MGICLSQKELMGKSQECPRTENQARKQQQQKVQMKTKCETKFTVFWAKCYSQEKYTGF